MRSTQKPFFWQLWCIGKGARSIEILPAPRWVLRLAAV